MKKIAILGSTGSIGTQTLDVAGRDPDRYRIVGLAAGANVERLVEQARAFRPSVVSLATKEAAEEAASLLPSDIRVVYGEDGLMEVAAYHVDVVRLGWGSAMVTHALEAKLAIYHDSGVTRTPEETILKAFWIAA